MTPKGIRPLQVPVAGQDQLLAHAAFMSSLPACHDALAELVRGRPFHYVDIPVHGNIGDLLIFQGTLAFFRRKNLVPKVIAPAFAFRPGWIGREDAIVFHGGGNFGDLYAGSGSHALRERIAQEFPGNRILILPQTFHFSSSTDRHASATKFRTHPDLHICVRDESSRQMALEFSRHVYLVPDMAHHLYPVSARRGGGAGTLLLSRTDDEKTAEATRMGERFPMKSDWPQVVGARERRIDQFRRAMRRAAKYGLGTFGSRVLGRAWAEYSATLIADAVELFASSDHVVTDRLHGHILACLMNKSSTVVDNFYGKNFSYVNAWTAGSALVTLHGR